MKIFYNKSGLFERNELIIGFSVFIFAIIFSLYTNHKWEDWFITYRVSKNLANGHGLVYAFGERTHTFTSPLGVLIPAFINYITLDTSDEIVIWIYRIICITALSFAVLFLKKTYNEKKACGLSCLVAISMIVLDPKIVDFCVNGMETSFMLFFLSLMLYAAFVDLGNNLSIFVVCFSGLMWTRPDSFIYFLSFSVGMVVFYKACPYVRSRKELICLLLKAAIISLILYLPWIIFTSFYYGSPIPHTIIAKGLFIDKTFYIILRELLFFPVTLLIESSAIDDVFMPSYHFIGGWPLVYFYVFKGLALTGVLYWTLPCGTAEGRAVSFTMFMVCFYLTVVEIRAPWYFPSAAFLGIFVIGQIVNQIYNLNDKKNAFARFFAKYTLPSFVVFFVFFESTMAFASVYQIKNLQEIVEDGNRKRIGLWLRENAETNEDTVFLEPLGYVGFYSQLKILDWPGLASKEVVNARRKIGEDSYAKIIKELRPKWLVLHDNEIDDLNKQNRSILLYNYEAKIIFDVNQKIINLGTTLGDPLLYSYAKYTIYKERRI